MPNSWGARLKESQNVDKRCTFSSLVSSYIHLYAMNDKSKHIQHKNDTMLPDVSQIPTYMSQNMILSNTLHHS